MPPIEEIPPRCGLNGVEPPDGFRYLFASTPASPWPSGSRSSFPKELKPLTAEEGNPSIEACPSLRLRSDTRSGVYDICSTTLFVSGHSAQALCGTLAASAADGVRGLRLPCEASSVCRGR